VCSFVGILKSSTVIKNLAIGYSTKMKLINRQPLIIVVIGKYHILYMAVGPAALNIIINNVITGLS